MLWLKMSSCATQNQPGSQRGYWFTSAVKWSATPSQFPKKSCISRLKWIFFIIQALCVLFLIFCREKYVLFTSLRWETEARYVCLYIPSCTSLCFSVINLNTESLCTEDLWNLVSNSAKCLTLGKTFCPLKHRIWLIGRVDKVSDPPCHFSLKYLTTFVWVCQTSETL